MDKSNNIVTIYSCSFCGKNASQVEYLVQGMIGAICTYCLGIAIDLIRQKREEDAKIKSDNS